MSQLANTYPADLQPTTAWNRARIAFRDFYFNAQNGVGLTVVDTFTALDIVRRLHPLIMSAAREEGDAIVRADRLSRIRLLTEMADVLFTHYKTGPGAAQAAPGWNRLELPDTEIIGQFAIQNFTGWTGFYEAPNMAGLTGPQQQVTGGALGLVANANAYMLNASGLFPPDASRERLRDVLQLLMPLLNDPQTLMAGLFNKPEGADADAALVLAVDRILTEINEIANGAETPNPHYAEQFVHVVLRKLWLQFEVLQDTFVSTQAYGISGAGDATAVRSYAYTRLA